MPFDRSNSRGFLLALSSAVFFAAVSLGIRFWDNHLTVSGVLLTRGVAGLLILGSLACWKRSLKPKLEWRGALLPALVGLSGAMSSICLTGALMRIPIYQALTLHYLYPAVTAALSALLGQVELSRREAGLIALAIAGAIITIWPEGGKLTMGHLLAFKGYLLAFSGGFLYSLSLVLLRSRGDGQVAGFSGPLWFYSGWALIVPGLWSFSSGAALVPSLLSLAIGLVLGLLCVLALGTAYTAVKYWPAYKVGVVGLLEVVICTMASFMLFSDPFSLRALAGAALVVMSAVLLSLPASARSLNLFTKIINIISRKH